MTWLFGTDGYPPRWLCGAGWSREPWVGWLHVVSDALIAGAYLSIPVLLIYAIRKRDDVPFHWVGGLFAAFILCCGATHALDAVIFWQPVYRLSGLAKAATAAVSWATVAALLWVLPAVLRLPGRAATADRLAAEAAERVRAERAARDARAAADSANAAKSRFLAAMSHELRTPLAAVLGYADLIEGADDAADRRAMVGQVKSNGRYLLTLLNDVLDLSKVEAGRMQVDREPTELVPLLEEVRSLMSVQAAESGLRLDLDFLGPVPHTVETDAVRLRQCLLNLLSNAVKFTERGGVRLEVRYLPPGAGGEPDGGPRVRFDVRDTGVGMDEGQLAGLFKPFGQVDRDCERRAGGTGLGLAITKRLAELLGGGVSVESEPGVGSTFRLTVAAGADAGDRLVDPRAEPAGGPARPAEPPVTADDPEAVAAPAAGVRALLAEDTRILAALYGRVLESAGAAVTPVGDGRAAVDAWADRPADFDVILLDMQMPRLDGFGAAAELRAAGCGLPIVAITAGAMAGDRKRCLAAGCDGYLSKPVDHAELVRVVVDLARPAAASGSAA